MLLPDDWASSKIKVNNHLFHRYVGVPALLLSAFLEKRRNHLKLRLNELKVLDLKATYKFLFYCLNFFPMQKFSIFFKETTKIISSVPYTLVYVY